MNFTEARKLHKHQYFGGKNRDMSLEDYEFPYNFLYEEETFIEKKIPIEMLEMQYVDSKRVDKYKKIDIEKMGPSWLLFGKKLKDGTISRFWHLKFYVIDGNHRAKAQHELGRLTIPAIMPKSHYDLYIEVINDKNS